MSSYLANGCTFASLMISGSLNDDSLSFIFAFQRHIFEGTVDIGIIAKEKLCPIMSKHKREAGIRVRCRRTEKLLDLTPKTLRNYHTLIVMKLRRFSTLLATKKSEEIDFAKQIF